MDSRRFSVSLIRTSYVTPAVAEEPRCAELRQIRAQYSGRLTQEQKQAKASAIASGEVAAAIAWYRANCGKVARAR